MSYGRDVIYIYDGTFEGLLSAIFIAYSEKCIPSAITSDEYIQQCLFADCRSVSTDYTKAKRIWDSLNKKISSRALRNIYYAYLSNHNNKELICYNYARACYHFGPDVDLHLSCAPVNDILKIGQRVRSEAHQYIEFVRFSELENGVFYSEIAPNCDILPLIASHFKKRLSNMPWIIHDLNRMQCIVYNGKECYISPTDTFPKVIYSENEKLYRRMWKDFYDTIEIKERHNEKCQNTCLPKKFRRYMTEFCD